MVPVKAAPCALCGRPLEFGGEAVPWVGATLAHVVCADPFGGP